MQHPKKVFILFNQGALSVTFVSSFLSCPNSTAKLKSMTRRLVGLGGLFLKVFASLVTYELHISPFFYFQAVLFNFSATNPTQVNGSAIDGPVQLRHGDVITVIDRSFRSVAIGGLLALQEPALQACGSPQGG